VKGWLLPAALTVVLLAAGGVGAYVVPTWQAAQDVRGSYDVEFRREAAPEPPERPPTPGVAWPEYGYGPERLRAVDFPHRPPYRRLWTFGARTLLEFPPAIAYGRLYFANNAGVVFAVNAETGRRAWRFRSGRCVASSPAVSNHTVFQTFLYRHPCGTRRETKGTTGEVIAFAAGWGRIRWRRQIGPSESSPLVANGMVYVGDWNGVVHALDERTGETRWTFRTGDQVKAGPTLSGRRLYIGSYDHHMYALDALTGRLLWRASAQERFGSRGTFYSTAAAAYGRVYVGSTDGKVYSFGAGTGRLRWSQDTGGYVYSSPAVWDGKVYAGSYSRRFFCFDAATGDIRWSFRANGPISGSPTVVNGVVYFATLNERTYALDARTGRQLWTFPDGKYTPVVADTERLYLVGLGRIYGMAPRAS
jgi:outer membrane protein assembly factor BamB